MDFPLCELGRLSLCRRAHIELNDAWHQNDGSGMTIILEHCEPQGFSTIKKNAAASPFLVLNNPMAATVLAEQES